MTTTLHRVNDGSDRKPRLELHQSWWSMMGLGDGTREWSMEEKFERIAEAGFTGILARLPEEPDAEKWRRLLDAYGFSFGVHSFPATGAELASFLAQAKRFGVQYVNSQVMDSFVIDADAVRLLDELTTVAKHAEVPYFVETHRGRITQDLIRTAEYARRVADLRFTIDLSHYVLAGEMELEQPKSEAYFDTLLQRTSCIHGRVSNGEQIQIDMGADASHPMVERFRRWWAKGMTYWLQEAQQGDVLPFVCELGPPSYAIRHPLTDQEVSDRWQQALVMKAIAEQVWHEVHI